MKREIKFRAWDKKESKIRGILKLNLNNEIYDVMLHTPTDSAPNHWCLRNYDEVELMQFTGLHDKNGKEIYEGDILDGQMIVTWRNDLASFALTKQGWAYDHYFGEAVDPGHTEVIGNIHQNPELLQP